MKIYYGTKMRLSDEDRETFSRGGYECKKLLQTRKGEPVAISQSKDESFPVWKVECGTSCMVFATYREAMDYCKRRYLNLDGKEV